MKEEQLIETLKNNNISLSNLQQEQFTKYYQLLIEWNEKVNLTSITDKNEVYLKHFYDSLTPAFYHDFSQPLTMCDVGAGAGFPSIPLKICFPQIELTIVDSLRKRIDFLKLLAKELQLENIHFYHKRAEDFGQNKQFREAFDLCIARAVAKMSVLSELCLPLVRIGGKFIAMKGAKADEELALGKAAIKRLGGNVLNNYAFNLPKDAGERSLIIIEKKAKTPKRYPRKPGTPQRKPLK